MKKGFTLIELLVVVLIIGILAAVALPQYQKAVEKSRATEAIQLLKQLANAENIFLMNKGVYTKDITALDLQLPGISGTQTALTKNYKIEVANSSEGSSTLTATATRGTTNGTTFTAASTPYAYKITLTVPANGQATLVCAKTASGADAASTNTCTSIANGKTDGKIEG